MEVFRSSRFWPIITCLIAVVVWALFGLSALAYLIGSGLGSYIDPAVWALMVAAIGLAIGTKRFSLAMAVIVGGSTAITIFVALTWHAELGIDLELIDYIRVILARATAMALPLSLIWLIIFPKVSRQNSVEILQ